MVVWLQFTACTAVIVYAGSRLSKYGDIIAEKTGLGRLWVGALLLAAVTSLPELVSGVAAVTVFDLPDIAVGGVLGSCMFNLLILSLVDAMTGRKPIYTGVNEGHVISAGFGVLLLGLIAVNIYLGGTFPAVGWICVFSFVYFALYVVAMRVLFLYNKRRIAAVVREMAEELRYRDVTAKRAYALYAVNAVVIVLAAAYLPHLGERIAAMTGFGQTFVGSFFIALSTSLPELVVTVAAIRLGAVDLALGNLFGSNLFNIAILAVEDFLYFKGPLLGAASDAHVVTAGVAIAMTAAAIVGLTYRTIKRPFFLAWDSMGILGLYFMGQVILYVLK
ncbi:MAG TPA: sodium:calcium antiporter [bacterium]|nr:sodium:calcium antiporter [bacterium]